MYNLLSDHNVKISCFFANQGQPGPNKSWFNSRGAGSFRRNPEKPDPILDF
jgi:hypothetical protein